LLSVFTRVLAEKGAGAQTPCHVWHNVIKINILSITQVSILQENLA